MPKDQELNILSSWLWIHLRHPIFIVDSFKAINKIVNNQKNCGWFTKKQQQQQVKCQEKEQLSSQHENVLTSLTFEQEQITPTTRLTTELNSRATPKRSSKHRMPGCRELFGAKIINDIVAVPESFTWTH